LKDIILPILHDSAFLQGTAWNYRLFQVNEVIIHTGEISKYLYLVEQGKLRVTVQVELERQKNMRPGICDLEAGDIFGETSLHQNHTRTASVTGISDGRLIEIDAEHFIDYLDTHSAQGYLFFKKLFGILVDRMHRGNQRFESLLAWGLKVHDIEKHF
jgi:CRP-like cAMP-binding protein